LVTRVGDDGLGREVLDRFGPLEIPTNTVQVDPRFPTGTVAVTLATDGQPLYSIVENVAWDHISADDQAMAIAAQADAICFGSLAQRSQASRDAIRSLVSATPPQALRIFDVNLRHPFVDRDVIVESLEMANFLKLNDVELPALAAMFRLPLEDREAMSKLAERFQLKLVALTRGPGGSLLLAGGEWSENPGQSVSVCDTIGAGDAFTAALTVGFLAGLPLDEINRRAGAVAAFVCTQPGGTPLMPESLRWTQPTFLENRS
jgi:fructokinase